MRIASHLSAVFLLSSSVLVGCPPPDMPESGAPDCLEPLSGTFDAAGGRQTGALTPGGLLSYGLTVDSPTGLTLTLQYDNANPDGSGLISVVEACEQQRVLGSVGGELDTLALAVPAGDYIVEVRSEDIALQEGFTLDLSTTSVVDHAFCSSPLVLDLDATVQLAEDSGGDAACTDGSGLSGFWYEVTIGPGEALRALSDAQVELAAVETCGSADGCTPALGDVALINRGDAAQTRRFVLASSVAQAVTFERLTVPTNSACETPDSIMLIDEAASVEGNLAFGTADQACSGELPSLASALYYAVEVPAGRRLLVSVDDEADAALSLLEGCDDTCVTEPPVTEATFDNLGGAPAEVVIVVGATAPGAGGFSLSLSLDG
jgi:hypothetical protein